DGLPSAGEPGGDRPLPLWPGTLGGPGRAGDADDSALPSECELLWAEREPPWSTLTAVPPATVAAPLAVLGEQLFAPLAGGKQPGLACYHLAGKEPRRIWHYPLTAGVHASPAAFRDTVWCVDGKPGEAGRRLHALGAAGGNVRWQVPVQPLASGVLVATEDRLLVQDRDGEMSCLDHAGQRQWSQKVGKLTHAPAATPTMIVAA